MTTTIRTDDLEPTRSTILCPRCNGRAQLVRGYPDARCTECGHQDAEERFLLGPSTVSVTLESPDDRQHDLGTWEVVQVGVGEVYGNRGDSGWATIAVWDDEAAGWRAEEGGPLFEDVYVAPQS